MSVIPTSVSLDAEPSPPRRRGEIAKPAGSATTPMMTQYLAIKADNPDCLVFFRMGDFYELFFEDAENAAKALDIALTKRGKHEGRDIPMCGVPAHAAESYLARLIRKGFKVAVAEQTEEPAAAKARGGKALVRREVRRVVTAGTLTEDSLLEARTHNFLAALARAGGRLGLAWLDLSTGLFRTQGLADGAAGDLAALLNRIEPSEILVSEPLLEEPPLSALLKEWRGKLTPLPASRFDSRNGEGRLCRAYGVSELTAFGSFDRAEIAAAGAALDYVELTQRGAMPNLQPLQAERPGSAMEIDPATARNLELFAGAGGDRRGGLVADIDRSLTGPGARLLRGRIGAPATDPAVIKERLDAAEACLNDAELRTALRRALERMPDVERALSRLALGRGGPRDLGAMRAGLAAAENLRAACAESGGEAVERLADWARDLAGFEILRERLDRALAAELPVKTREGGFIAVGYAEALDEQRRLRDESRRLIAELQARYAAETGVASLKIKHNNVIGYFIEISAAQAGKVDGRAEFRHRQTMAGSMRFATDELADLETAIRQAADKALALEIELFDDLTGEIVGRAKDLTRLAAAAARLDVAAATAELAAERDFRRPEIGEDLAFVIEGGRHPVVETALRQQDGAVFRANDCRLDGQDRLWLVTGPNMAGKSTFLRQNALIAVLAQAGLYVPAARARIGVADRLFSRVGAADDLARGRSTFMVEMVETATILNRATSRSLVILDEIGRGTATFDGLSIAWAVAEHLHEVNCCRALFATHYRELAALAAELPGLGLHRMAVKEWRGEVKFLYAVEAGAAEGSYGVHVAKLAGLPAGAVARARQVLAALEDGERGGALARLAGDLPLFSQVPARSDDRADEPGQSVMETLAGIDPDSLNPRQALDWLYRLKALAEGDDDQDGAPDRPGTGAPGASNG